MNKMFRKNNIAEHTKEVANEAGLGLLLKVEFVAANAEADVAREGQVWISPLMRLVFHDFSLIKYISIH